MYVTELRTPEAMNTSYQGVYDYLCGLENDPDKQLQAQFGNDTAEADISAVSTYDKDICPNWVKTGECKNRLRCPFTHPKLEGSLMVKLWLAAKNGQSCARTRKRRTR